MSVKSLQGRCTTYATRIKLMKLKVQNMTVKTNESWADSWRCRVLMQIECRWADCSTPQDQRRRMPDCQDEVWCEGRRGLHKLQNGERREWKLMRLVHISPVCNLVPYHSAPYSYIYSWPITGLTTTKYCKIFILEWDAVWSVHHLLCVTTASNKHHQAAAESWSFHWCH